LGASSTRRALALGTAALLALGLWADPGAATRRRRARVTSVTDGDTVTATWKGRSRDVRLIGVDTPETVHPSEPVQCYGPEASAFSEKRLEGARVRLEFDQERKDRYDRTLAYIWQKGRLFNLILVRRGFARVSIYPPNDRYEDRLRRAEDRARELKRGLWGECQGGGGGGGGDGDGCDPSYPTVCIPPPPPDLDCGDIPHRNFTVVGSDPHGFDGDGDGIGCES